MFEQALSVFVGHDSREADATLVCEASMRTCASKPLFIQRLTEPALRHNGFYQRAWRIKDGQRIDQKDGKPFSTDFAFTRFLVPALMQNAGWSVFCDADFLWLADIAQLFGLADKRYAVQVVKRKAQESDVTTKMDGQAQQSYPRKNWSSLILWNCAHPANQRLTPREANYQSGQWLHGFSWLEDSEIGELPPEWNWLSSIDAPLRSCADPKAVHFTLGIPSMPGYSNSPYAEHWRAVLAGL
jgi:hypothetical protein